MCIPGLLILVFRVNYDKISGVSMKTDTKKSAIYNSVFQPAASLTPENSGFSCSCSRIMGRLLGPTSCSKGGIFDAKTGLG
jgi:hypothetical protein